MNAPEDPPPLTDAELRALASLLDEEDPEARSHVEGRLREAAAASPGRLARAIEELPAAEREPAARLLQDVGWDRLERQFARLAKSPEPRFDLEKAALLLARIERPALPKDALSAPLDAMAADLGRMLSGREKPVEVLQILNDHLFELKGFRTEGEDRPESILLPSVLERKAGAPVALAGLYLLLGDRLELPFAVIAPAGLLVVEFQPAGGRALLDPAREGKLVTPEDCLERLARQGQDGGRALLKPLSRRMFFARWVADLARAHTVRGDVRMAARLMGLLKDFVEG